MASFTANVRNWTQKKNAIKNYFLTEQLLLVSLTRYEETVLPVRVRACKNSDTSRISHRHTYKLCQLHEQQYTELLFTS